MMRPMTLTPASPTMAHNPGLGFSCKPPWEWSRNEVTDWILQCEREYSLDKIDLQRFAMNGKALYILTKQDFVDRVPSIGDVLYNYIHIVSEESRRPLLCTYAPSPPQRTKLFDEMAFPYAHLSSPNNTPLPQPLYAKVQPPSPGHATVHHCEGNHPPGSPRLQDSFTRMLGHGILEPQREEGPENLTMYERREEGRYLDLAMTPSPTSSSSDTIPLCDAPDADERRCQERLLGENSQEVPTSPLANVEQAPKRNKGEGRLLWDFLSNLLKTNSAPNVVSWDDVENDIFRIHDAGALAVLWGRQKNRSNMTYEKMSRALRYYYKMNIIQKVKGKRLTYKFMKKPDEIRRNRGLALRFRAQQRRETSLQNASSAPSSSPVSPSVETSHLQENEIKMDANSYPDTPTNGVLYDEHLNETKPVIGQSLELNKQFVSAASSQLSQPSRKKYETPVEHLGFNDGQKYSDE